MRAGPLHDAGAVHRTGLARDLAPATEKGERRNAADVVTRAEGLLGFGIHLEQAHARFELRRRLRVVRRHHPAWPAPRRPEVHQQRDVVVRQMLLEGSRVHFDRLALEQWPATLPAGRRRIETSGRQAVHRPAVRTHDVQRAVHRTQPASAFAASSFSAFSNTSGGCPPGISQVLLTMVAGTEWMPACWKWRSCARTSSVY